MTRPNFIPVVFAIGFAALIALYLISVWLLPEVCVSSMMVEADGQTVTNPVTCR